MYLTRKTTYFSPFSVWTRNLIWARKQLSWKGQGESTSRRISYLKNKRRRSIKILLSCLRRGIVLLLPLLPHPQSISSAGTPVRSAVLLGGPDQCRESYDGLQTQGGGGDHYRRNFFTYKDHYFAAGTPPKLVGAMWEQKKNQRASRLKNAAKKVTLLSS